LHEFPQAVKEKDRNNCYPLLIAFNYYQSNRVLTKLIEEFPQAAKEKDANGIYPLQFAFIHGKSEAFIFKLMNAYPQVAKKNDDVYHCFPLHYAWKYMGPEHVVLKVIDEFSYAVKVRDNKGSNTVMTAIRNQYSENVVLKLLTEFPQIAKVSCFG
jgi:hypothetical protein